jgi:hypothetical protein
MFTDDYLGIVRNGVMETLDQLLARSARLRAQRSPMFRGVGQPLHDVRVRVYGGLAVVTAPVFNQGEDIRFLRVFVKRAAEWKIAS